jgi:WD40 repeat protein
VQAGHLFERARASTHASSIKRVAVIVATSLLFLATGCGSKQVTQPPLAGELAATVADGSKIIKVAWSSTGHLATSDADAVAVWNPPAMEPIRTFSTVYGSMFALSPNGHSLAAFTKDGTWNVMIWNVTTGELERTLVNNSTPVGPTQSFRDLSWSPDGQWIAVASTLGARIFNTATGALTWEFEGGASNLDAVSWSPDGTRLAANLGLSEIQIWDITDGRATATTALDGWPRRLHRLVARREPNGDARPRRRQPWRADLGHQVR